MSPICNSWFLSLTSILTSIILHYIKKGDRQFTSYIKKVARLDIVKYSFNTRVMNEYNFLSEEVIDSKTSAGLNCTPVHSVPARARLRSADHGEMIISRTRTVRFGPRSFRVSAPTVWNSLPDSLKSEDTPHGNSSSDC